VAQISVAETTTKSVAGVSTAAGDTNVTVVNAGGKSVKLVPVITITHPAGPLVGENDVMVGAAAKALGAPKDNKAAAQTIIRTTREIRFMRSTPPLGADWSQSAASGRWSTRPGGLIHREALALRDSTLLSRDLRNKTINPSAEIGFQSDFGDGLGRGDWAAGRPPRTCHRRCMFRLMRPPGVETSKTGSAGFDSGPWANRFRSTLERQDTPVCIA